MTRVPETPSGGEKIGTKACAEIFGVVPATITRWADLGLIPHTKLPTGVRRYRLDEMQELAARGITPASEAAAAG